MYKLMIVEDEPIEREALKLMIQNNCSGVQLVAEADNGFAAIERYNTFQPEIIIVDINMPGLNGLDMIRELKSKNTQISFLIISSYNRFEFAQEAIKLGAEDFILKPTKMSQVIQAIEQITKKLDNQFEEQNKNTALLHRMEAIRPVIESDCIYGLITNTTGTELDKMFSFLDFKISSGFCFVVDCQANKRFLLGKIKHALGEVGIKCIGEQFHELLVFFVLEERQIEPRRLVEISNFIRMLLQESGASKSFVGIGRSFDGQHLNNSYRQSLEALEFCKTSMEPICIFSHAHENKENPRSRVEKYIQKLSSAISLLNKKEVDETLAKAVQELIIRSHSFSDAKEDIYKLIILTENKLKAENPMINLDNSSPNHIQDRRELEFYLVTYMDKLLESYRVYKTINTNYTINRAMNLIHEQYPNNISLETISAELNISSFYLSKLIKKHAGKNFTDLVATLRIDKAKELLKQNMSVKEVTFQVGFNSQNYFTKIFRKYVGVTPSEYKGK